MPEDPNQPRIFQPEVTSFPPLDPPRIPNHTLVKCIGSGSYGDVWLARTTGGAWRAVKVVHRQSFQKDKPFEREYTGILKFEPVSRTHEGMVDIIQVGRDEATGSFYYIMELADDAVIGTRVEPDRYIPKTIGQVLEQRRRLPFEECLRLAMGLASALGHLHDHGLIHRDIKPGNIIFVDGQPKLADIGLVAEVSDARSFVGTEGYIPPEGPGTPAADIFGLGKVLYEMATGLDRKSYPELPDDFHQRPDHAGLLEFNEIILKACASSAEDRYHNVAELMADLALLQSGKSIRQARTLARRLSAARRWGMAATLMAAIFGGAYFFATYQAERAQRAERKEKLATQEATSRLYDSLLAQARLGKFSRETGRREEAMIAIRAAADIHPSQVLRQEVISTMIMHDLEETGWFRKGPAIHSESIAFNPSFTRYAMQMDNGEIHVRNRQTDDILASFPTPSPLGVKVWFSPDEQHLIVNNRSTREIIFWHWIENKVLWTYVPPDNNVWAYHRIHMSPKGDVLLVVPAERKPTGKVLLFEAATGQQLEPLEWKGKEVRVAEFNHRGDRIAVGAGSSIEVLSWPSRKRLNSKRLARSYTALAWHPHGKRLAVGLSNGTIYLFTRDPSQELELRGHNKNVSRLIFNHSGDVLVSVAWDASTRFWDAANGEILCSTQQGIGVQFREDDEEMAFLQTNRGAGLWKLIRPKGLKRFNVERSQSSEIRGVDFSSDGRWMISGHGTSWRLWDRHSTSRPQRVSAGNRVRDVQFLADPMRVLVAGAFGIREWSLSATNPATRPRVLAHPRKLYDKSILRIDVSQDGRHVAAAANRTAFVVDGQDPQQVKGLQKQGWEYHDVQLLHGKPWMITSDRSWDRTRVWNREDGSMVKELGRFYCYLSASPDGETLITGSAIELAFWQTGSWEKRFSLPLNLGSRTGIQSAVSPDNRLVAAGIDRVNIHLFELATGKPVTILHPPKANYIHSLRFSADSRLLGVATEDYEIQVWDLEVIRKELAGLNLDW